MTKINTGPFGQQCVRVRLAITDTMKQVRPIFWGIALTGVLALFLVRQPVSEWVAGGWDPGVYMNQGIYQALHGCGSPPIPAYADMVRAGVPVFAREQCGRYEAFPGIPIDIHTGAFDFYFYPVTPLWVGLLFRVGGMGLAQHAMGLLGILSGVLLFGGLRRMGWPAARASLVALLLLSQPIVLYHMHTPCSEMMELTIMTAILGVLAGGSAVWLGLLVAVGCLNRPGFMALAAILALLLAGGGGCCQDRRASGWAVAWVGVGLACALAYYHLVGAGSVAKIHRAFVVMEWASVAVLVLSLALVWLRRWPLVARALRSRWVLLTGPGLTIGVFLLAVAFNPRGAQEARVVALHLGPYTGWPLLVLAGAGLAIAMAEDLYSRKLRPCHVFVVLSLAAMALPLGYKHVADLYPWATKRFVSSLPLVIAFGSGAALWWLWSRGNAGRWAAAVLLLGVLGWNAGRISQAWSRVEYSGMCDVLSDIAARIEPDDIVLADHFVWATPLALIYDCQVMNGVPLWSDPSVERVADARALFESWHREGRRILLLTSTEQGSAIFPSMFHTAQPIMDPVAYDLQVIAHHRNSTGFWVRQEQSKFVLSEWVPCGDER